MDNSAQVSKATYGLPLALFPSDELVECWYKEPLNTLTPYEQELRTLSWLSYSKVSAPDKELTRFMVPSFSWPEAEAKSSSYTPLGKNSLGLLPLIKHLLFRYMQRVSYHFLRKISFFSSAYWCNVYPYAYNIYC